ncbi:hypothetical protein BX666DRAFT_1213569 [Dichotomocladium elegans]|nr:hypothetical protein BX666DRAFT_1213569 [Dichotomocladium elegans]
MPQPVAPPSPPATTSSTHNTTHKKHNRHHVKRRSSGRVHVTKLAPMARAKDSHTDTEVDDHDGKRPHMRRSQSQRSLNRLSSFERKGAGLTALASIHPPKTNNTATPVPASTTITSSDVARAAPAATKVTPQPATPSPPTSATDKDEDEEEGGGEVSITRKPPKEESRPPPRSRKDNPVFFVSSRAPAAPIEQTLTATAKNLVGPDREAIAPLHNSTTIATSTISYNNNSGSNNNSNSSKRGQPLRSQFVDDTTDPPHRQQQLHQPVAAPNGNNSRRLSNVAAAANAQPPGMTRTQQKLLLQRQHCLVDDENNLAHPRNMLRLTREIERVGKEYRCVRQYCDPMVESLRRCLQEQEQQEQQQQHREPIRLQQRTKSSSVLPTSMALEPHALQRQAIHRRHLHLKLMAETANQPDTGLLNAGDASSTSSTLDMIRWSAGALLDRVWAGTGFN